MDFPLGSRKIDISKLHNNNNNENCLKADSKVILKQILIKFRKLSVGFPSSEN